MCGHHHGAVSDGDMVVNGSTADHTCGIGAVSSHMCRLRTCSPLHFSTYLKETTRLIGGICFSSGARLGLAMCSAHSEEHESISHAASTHQTRAALRGAGRVRGAPSSELRVHHPSPLLELGCHRTRPRPTHTHVTHTQATIRREEEAGDEKSKLGCFIDQKVTKDPKYVQMSRKVRGPFSIGCRGQRWRDARFTQLRRMVHELSSTSV